MEFNKDAEVFTNEDEKVGTVNRIVIDPKSNEITHLVVEQGFLFTEDKVIPISMVGPSDEDRITLRVSKDDLESLPEFEETLYLPQDSGAEFRGELARKPRALFLNPPFGHSYWMYGGYALPPYVVHTERFIPKGTVPLKEGAQVLDLDGNKIGKVESLLTDPVENRITHMVISRGMIFGSQKLIPSLWISTVLEDEIHLSVNEKIIESLPDYETEPS